MKFNFNIGPRIYEMISIKLGMMIESYELYSLVRAALTFIHDHRRTRQPELLHSVFHKVLIPHII